MLLGPQIPGLNHGELRSNQKLLLLGGEAGQRHGLPGTAVAGIGEAGESGWSQRKVSAWQNFTL